MLRDMTIQSGTLTDIARRLNDDYGQGCRQGQGSLLPSSFFITDEKAIPQPEKIIATLPRGFAVILRDYDSPQRAALGTRLSELCRAGGLKFLVAGDVSLASFLKADGIHLAEHVRHQATSIRERYPDWLITASCHSQESLKGAEGMPLDAALVSPVFPTSSHPETLSGEKDVLGWEKLREMVSTTTFPLYALGGITGDNAHKLVGLGLAGLAAIRGFKA